MGFLNNIFSSFEKNAYKGICKAMINSYNKLKKAHPDTPQKELYAQALSLRPTWKREASSFSFKKGERILTIKDGEKFSDVVRNVIILETIPVGASRDQTFIANTLRNISEVLAEEFKVFEE